MCRLTEEKVGPTVGLLMPLRHFVGFFNVPVQEPTRWHPFYKSIPRNRPIELPFTTRLGYGGHTLDLSPGSQQGPNASEEL